MNKNNSVTITLPDNGMCALVKKIDGRYEIDTGRIKGKDIFFSPWVKTADRLPTEADADSELMIMAWHIYFGYEAVAYGSVIDEPEMFTYWMPIPPLPEVEE